MTDLTVVIPTYNEAAALPALLDDLRRQQGVALEIIVADGGSTDGTAALATAAGATVVNAPRGRGAQMNAAARAARSGLLLFLHADSRLQGASQLRDALQALKHALAESNARIAGHWPLRFARTQPGHELFYRYLESKTALNRPGTVNGDQGLLIEASWLRQLGGFDERLPFLEDQRLAAKVFDNGHFIVLPGVLATSARRFETEGAHRRYTLMALIMGLHAAGAEEFFARPATVYATQDATGRLRLGGALLLARQVLREAGWRGAIGIVWRAGRYTNRNSWQLFHWLDVAMRTKRRTCLWVHDTFVRPVIHNFVGDAVVAAGIALWFLLVLPVAYRRA